MPGSDLCGCTHVRTAHSARVPFACEVSDCPCQSFARDATHPEREGIECILVLTGEYLRMKRLEAFFGSLASSKSAGSLTVRPPGKSGVRDHWTARLECDGRKPAFGVAGNVEEALDAMLDNAEIRVVLDG